ncbi:hypothetical protein B5X24_HaOG213972 [Helicoverpa armigera]|nr:hypothetical protein B5X24_HaOG213972 [Helicoverpa armigera]
MFLQLLLLLSTAGFFTITNAARPITVYGDVLKDVEFFTKTFPWIIDSIGGDLIVDYALLGSGRYSIPQMCALKQLRKNTYLQAEYLKCEAEGNKNVSCVSETGINPRMLKKCVAGGGYLAKLAASKYSKLNINYSPIIGLGSKSTVFGVEDKFVLEKICTIFGNKLPLGCVKACTCDEGSGQNSEESDLPESSTKGPESETKEKEENTEIQKLGSNSTNNSENKESEPI